MPPLYNSDEQEGQVNQEQGFLLKSPHLRPDSTMSCQSLYDRR